MDYESDEDEPILFFLCIMTLMLENYLVILRNDFIITEYNKLQNFNIKFVTLNTIIIHVIKLLVAEY